MNQVLCKWVSEDMKTKNNTKWKVGVPNELPENKNLWLCSKGLFHYCKHPLIAVMFKHLHACDHYTKLYEVLPEGMIVDGWDKCGSTKLTLVKELEIPNVNDIQRIAFSILCAKEVYKEPKFVDWANNWLSGKNRSQAAANAANAAVAHALHAAYADYKAATADYKAATAEGVAEVATATAHALHAAYADYKAAYAAEGVAEVATAYAAYAAEVDTVNTVNTAYYDTVVHRSIFSAIHSAHIDLISLVYKAMEIQ